MAEEILYEDLNDLLLREFPELKEKYSVLKEFWDGSPPPHATYGEMFTREYVIPMVVRAMSHQGCSNEDQVLVRVFDFIEMLAKSCDEEVRDLVQVTVCWELGRRKDILEFSRRMMGKRTLKYSELEEGDGVFQMMKNRLRRKST